MPRGLFLTIVLALTLTTTYASSAAEVTDEEKFFEAQCGQCHPSSRVFLVALDEGQRRHVVERMRDRWEGGQYALDDADIERLLAYIEERSNKASETVAAAKDTSALEPKALFRERCSGCHQLDRIYQQVKAERGQPAAWLHVVTRMRAKAPEWISEAEAQRIVRYLRERTTPTVTPPAKVAPDPTPATREQVKGG